jgi:phosphatidylglycerophosphatase A
MTTLVNQGPRKPDWRFLLEHPAHFFAFGFGAGLARKAPGTYGTLVALPLYHWLLAWGLSAGMIALLCLPLFVFGIWVCDKSCRSLGVHDHGGIVWDEIVAMLLVLTAVPVSLTAWIVAFALFRLFDIVKPWPIRWLDAKVHGGFGVMLDDLVAALFAMVVLRLLLPWLW